MVRLKRNADQKERNETNWHTRDNSNTIFVKIWEHLLDVMLLIRPHWPYQCRHHSRWVAGCHLCRLKDRRPGIHSPRRISPFARSDLSVNWVLDLCLSLPIVSVVRLALTQPNCCVHRMTFFFSNSLSFLFCHFSLFLCVSLSATLTLTHSFDRALLSASLFAPISFRCFIFGAFDDKKKTKKQNIFKWKTIAEM